MKKAGATLAVVVVCVFLLTLHFGVPAPNVLNRAYTGVVVNIRENIGDLSVANLELSPKEAQAVLTAVQSHTYARRFPDGNVISYGPTQTVILSLIYQEKGTEKHDIFMINNAGVITVDDFRQGGGYILFPRDDRAQIQLFQTIYDSIPK